MLVRFRFLGLSLLAALGIQCGSLLAEAEPVIHVTGWGLTLAEDGTGFYNDLAAVVVQHSPAKPDYRIAPYKRAMRSFSTHKNACLYPKSIGIMERNKAPGTSLSLIQSLSFLRSPVRVFTLAQTPAISSLSELTGMTIAYALGSNVPESIDVADVEFVPIADEVDKAKILYSGTVDAVVANMPDAFFVFKSLGKSMPHYNKTFTPFAEQSTHFVCHDTPEARRLLRNLNKGINRVLEDGTLADFLSSEGLNPDEFLP